MSISPLQRDILEIAKACLEAGTPLPPDSAIAADLGAARMRVANALFRLRKRGLLQTDGRRVLMVVEVPPEAPVPVPEAPREPPENEVQVKLLALVRHCEKASAPWPPRRNILLALGISRSSLDHHLTALCDRGAIRREAPGDYRLGAR